MSIRKQIVECARAHVKAQTPYQWGGGHHGDSWGLDCSGLVLDCLRKAGIDPGFWDSSRMRNELPRVEVPQPGDVALYFPRHVVLVESFDAKTGIATIIGANGGGPSSTSPERAREQNAKTKREPTHLYRETFDGFRSIAPWGAEDWVEPGILGPQPVTLLLAAIVSGIGFWHADKKYHLTERAAGKLVGK